MSIISQFSILLLTWFDQHGRKNLPWQIPRSAYRIWIAEIMLQQTQVKTVIPYFNRFITRFPDVWQLVQASEDEVLAHWSGLGYYSRARNLYKTAQIICNQYQGEIPSELSLLTSLPGIGPSTAAAIASQAYNLPTAILDGNVKRVLCRYFLIDGQLEQALVKQQLWDRANQCMPKYRCADYTQAIMDLGATCCTPKNPNCIACPLKQNCLAHLNHQTTQYPQKKLKKTLPVKQQQFLLLYQRDGRIYLEKRPPTGLWGGLWCMPVIDDLATCPITYIQERYALISLKNWDLIAMKHRFSHFQLEIKSQALLTTATDEVIAESTGRWFHKQDIQKLGVAKPVHEIIHYFLRCYLELK